MRSFHLGQMKKMNHNLKCRSQTYTILMINVQMWIKHTNPFQHQNKTPIFVNLQHLGWVKKHWIQSKRALRKWIMFPRVRQSNPNTWVEALDPLNCEDHPPLVKWWQIGGLSMLQRSDMLTQSTQFLTSQLAALKITFLDSKMYRQIVVNFLCCIIIWASIADAIN